MATWPHRAAKYTTVVLQEGLHTGSEGGAGFTSRGSRSTGGRASRTALAKTGCVKGGTHSKIRPASMHHLFEMTDECQHRQHRFHEHAVLPLATLTQFEVGRIARRRMEAGVTQDNHALFKLPNEPLKGVIRHIGGRTPPPPDHPPLIEQQTEFATDNPAVIRETFPANLLGAAAFADGVNELDAIRVDAPEHGRRGQENLRPVLMGLQEPKEPRPLGQTGEQRPIVARQPAIEGTIPDPFERMQESQGDHLTGPEEGLRMFGDRAQLLIDLREQRRDKLDGGGHRRLRSSQGCTLATSVEEVPDHDKKASKHYDSYWFVRD